MRTLTALGACLFAVTSGYLGTGVLCLLLGLGATLYGAVHVLNHRGFTAAYYARVIRFWSAIPLIGPLYRMTSPFTLFRYFGGLLLPSLA